MSVEVPAEPVYYYECSSGEFRLIYFIPSRKLRHLKEKKGLSKQALHDFPDGVDLPCTEADFADFHQRYGYRPPKDPAALRSAFFALWTDTKNWKKTIHAGFLPRKTLEQHLGTVKDLLPPEPAPAATVTRPSLKERQMIQKHRTTRQKSVVNALKRLKMKGVNRARPLGSQDFGKIKMEKGESAQDLFIRLNQNRKGS